MHPGDRMSLTYLSWLKLRSSLFANRPYLSPRTPGISLQSCPMYEIFKIKKTQTKKSLKWVAIIQQHPWLVHRLIILLVLKMICICYLFWMIQHVMYDAAGNLQPVNSQIRHRLLLQDTQHFHYCTTATHNNMEVLLSPVRLWEGSAKLKATADSCLCRHGRNAHTFSTSNTDSECAWDKVGQKVSKTNLLVSHSKRSATRCLP